MGTFVRCTLPFPGLGVRPGWGLGRAGAVLRWAAVAVRSRSGWFRTDVRLPVLFSAEG
ncbi:MAG: hypothetical protein M3Y73_07240 [Actinomycetota bacterium]|nr:hypothetical protein [Actinomycetota bacterium]